MPSLCSSFLLDFAREAAAATATAVVVVVVALKYA